MACGSSPSDTFEPPLIATSSPICAELEVALPDGTCLRPGILPDGCGKGFEHDGEYGCEPILPAEDCLPAMMAVPGDTDCRPVMPCGEGRWGDLPVDAATQYVDGSYAGGDSDGSSVRPWRTIPRAVLAASSGGLIAVAAGRYPGRIMIQYKPIVLWGVCPEKVSIVGEADWYAIIVAPGADGTEIGGLAITGAAFGVGISGARDVTLDRLWIHHTDEPAILMEDSLGRSSAHVRGSLLESGHEAGIRLYGSDVTVISTLVRDTGARLADARLGMGLYAQPNCSEQACDPATRPKVRIEGSFFDRNRSHGVRIEGGDLNIEATLVRDTLPQLSDQFGGGGVMLSLACGAADGCSASQPSRASIVGSLIENNHNSGILALGSELRVETSVVRANQRSTGNGFGGTGVTLQPLCDLDGCDLTTGSTATIRSSLLERNHQAALFVEGSSVIFEHSVARRSIPSTSDSRHGVGVMAQYACDRSERCYPEFRSAITVEGCLIEDNHVAGISVVGATAHLKSTFIRRTVARQRDGLFGDGVIFLSDGHDEGTALGFIDNVSIEDAARAGLVSFGAEVSMANSTIACAAFELAGEKDEGRPYRFEDGGGNHCGCPEASQACKVVSAGLEPPQVLP